MTSPAGDVPHQPIVVFCEGLIDDCTCGAPKSFPVGMHHDDCPTYTRRRP